MRCVTSGNRATKRTSRASRPRSTAELRARYLILSRRGAEALRTIINDSASLRLCGSIVFSSSLERSDQIQDLPRPCSVGVAGGAFAGGRPQAPRTVRVLDKPFEGGREGRGVALREELS